MPKIKKVEELKPEAEPIEKLDDNISNEQEVKHCAGGNYETNTDQNQLQELQNEILRLTNENNSLIDKVKTAQAELINYRRRKDEETQSILKYSNQDLIQAMLPIVDNFERALNSSNENVNEQFLAGVKMIYASLQEVLKQFGVEELDCYGKPFDPKEAEALLVDNNPEMEDDVVTEVLLKGYKLKDRVIRPAKVKINQL